MVKESILVPIIALVITAIVSAVFTRILIPFLKKHQLKQFEKAEGPESHKKKTGTPSMGGIAMLAAMVLVSVINTLVTKEFNIYIIAVNIVMILHALMGFMDDYKKATEHKNDRLSAKKKLVLQFVISLAFAFFCYFTLGSNVYIPFWGEYLDFGIFYIPWIVFVMLSFSNSVNLTDGLDGLAAGVTALVAFAMLLIANNKMINDQAIFLGCLAGSCLGFLVYNHYPAKLFMGDTGSMAIGSGLAAAAIVMKLEIVLAIAGLVYVCESLSVIIQVSYFKATHGKRIFKMSPIHHHFELCGMKETSVVLMFYAAALVFSIIAIFSAW